MNTYTDYMLEQTTKILAIDSPSGFTSRAAEYVMEEYRKLGFVPQMTNKGGILVCVNEGRTENDAVLLASHIDTLGGMVCDITSSGRLMLTRLGGLDANNTETENCRIYTRDGRIYTGTFQLKNASIHVNGNYSDTSRSFETMEVLLDELVESKEDVLGLGILPGDIVCFEPRTVVTPSGYIKSRFLDDKLSVGILLGYA